MSRSLVGKNGELRFAYAICKTAEKANDVLEQMYADGDVFESERPRIERFRNVWCVSLPY